MKTNIKYLTDKKEGENVKDGKNPRHDGFDGL